MSDQVWPPPSSADPPRQQQDTARKRTVDLIGKSMVCLALVGVVMFWYVLGAKSNARYVQHANQEGTINRQRWDKLNPGWRKTYKEGPPRKLTEPEKNITNVDKLFGHGSGPSGF